MSSTVSKRYARDNDLPDPSRAQTAISRIGPPAVCTKSRAENAMKMIMRVKAVSCLLPPKPFQSHFVSVVSVVQASLHPGDRRRACTGLHFDLVIRAAFSEHPGDFQTLRHRLDFVHCAQIIKENIAFLNRLQCQNRFEQLVNGFIVQLL